MKKISEDIQEGDLLARKVGSGEVGILGGRGKKIVSSIYWNSKEDAIRDLLAIISYLHSDEDE